MRVVSRGGVESQTAQRGKTALHILVVEFEDHLSRFGAVTCRCVRGRAACTFAIDTPPHTDNCLALKRGAVARAVPWK